MVKGTEAGGPNNGENCSRISGLPILELTLGPKAHGQEFDQIGQWGLMPNEE